MGGGKPPAARVPAAALGTERSGGWSVPDPWASGPKQPRLTSQPRSSLALLGSLLNPPNCPGSPRPPQGGPAELEPPGDKAGC